MESSNRTGRAWRHPGSWSQGVAVGSRARGANSSGGAMLGWCGRVPLLNVQACSPEQARLTPQLWPGSRMRPATSCPWPNQCCPPPWRPFPCPTPCWLTPARPWTWSRGTQRPGNLPGTVLPPAGLLPGPCPSSLPWVAWPLALVISFTACDQPSRSGVVSDYLCFASTVLGIFLMMNWAI